MSMQGKLVAREGKLCVLYETTLYSAPEMTRLWWLVENIHSNVYHCTRPDVGDLAEYRGDGAWSTRRPDTHASSGSVSTGDGRREAIHKETHAVPPPKVRAGIETRWHEGRWQKYLKSKGWIDA